jgi:hypothetical protein
MAVDATALALLRCFSSIAAASQSLSVDCDGDYNSDDRICLRKYEVAGSDFWFSAVVFSSLQHQQISKLRRSEGCSVL